MEKKIIASIALFALALLIHGCCTQTYRFAWVGFQALNIDRNGDTQLETVLDTLDWGNHEILLDLRDSTWYASMAPFQLIEAAYATTCEEYLYNHHDLLRISVRTLDALGPDLPAGMEINDWLESRPVRSDSTAAFIALDSLVANFNDVVNNEVSGPYGYTDPGYDLDLRFRLKENAPKPASYRLQIQLHFNDSTRLVAETRRIRIQ